MEPYDVPVHFSRDTITTAVSTYLLGASTVFADTGDEHVLGQMFALFIGRLLERELNGYQPDPASALPEFIADTKHAVDADSRTRFAEVDPETIKTWYLHILRMADESNVDKHELARALFNIAAVIKYFSSQAGANQRTDGLPAAADQHEGTGGRDQRSG
jgi:hypothetical protein